MKRILSLIAGLSTIALMGLGCNPVQQVQQKVGEAVTEQAVKQATGGQVKADINGGQYTFTDNKTGSTYVAGDNVKLPDGLPQDVMIYPGSKAMSAIVSKADNGASVTLSTGDDQQKTVKWYEDQMKGAGFDEAASYTAGDTEMRSYHKDTVDVLVTVAADSDTGGSTISVVRTETSSTDSNQ